jgi:hypothetical protein
MVLLVLGIVSRESHQTVFPGPVTMLLSVTLRPFFLGTVPYVYISVSDVESRRCQITCNKHFSMLLQISFFLNHAATSIFLNHAATNVSFSIRYSTSV